MVFGSRSGFRVQTTEVAGKGAPKWLQQQTSQQQPATLMVMSEEDCKQLVTQKQKIQCVLQSLQSGQILLKASLQY